MHPAVLGLITIVIGVGGCVGYFYGANVFLDKVLFPASGPKAGRNINLANMIRPWIFLGPAILALGLYLAYPVVATFILSFQERLPGNARAFVGLENYTKMFAEPKFAEAMFNNVLWLTVVPAAATGFGLLAAQLTDRLSWGNISKSIIFMPMAISFVCAAVIFKLVYEARPEDVAQIGILNHLYLLSGGAEPQQWLTIPFWNSFFLMAVLIWIQTGFAMVILSKKPLRRRLSMAPTRSRFFLRSRCRRSWGRL